MPMAQLRLGSLLGQGFLAPWQQSVAAPARRCCCCRRDLPADGPHALACLQACGEHPACCQRCCSRLLHAAIVYQRQANRKRPTHRRDVYRSCLLPVPQENELRFRQDAYHHMVADFRDRAADKRERAPATSPQPALPFLASSLRQGWRHVFAGPASTANVLLPACACRRRSLPACRRGWHAGRGAAAAPGCPAAGGV